MAGIAGSLKAAVWGLIGVTERAKEELKTLLTASVAYPNDEGSQLVIVNKSV